MTPPKEQMNDAALEQDMERLFAVEPSAGFQARVRTRIASDSARPAGFEFWRSLILRGTVALAVCVVLVMLFVRTTQKPQPLTQVRVTPAKPESTPAKPEATQASVASRENRALPVRQAVDVVDADVITPAPRDPFSDVQVSASELRALRQAAALMAGKPLKEEEAPQVAAVRDDMTELMIAPISIEPIQIASIKGDAE